MPDQPHSAIARRLKRANGHLETIIEMIEQGRPCAKIAQQLQAVESAIENAKKALIHDHVSHSLERSFKASGSKGQAALRDFKLIAKYLSRVTMRTGSTLAICRVGMLHLYGDMGQVGEFGQSLPVMRRLARPRCGDRD